MYYGAQRVELACAYHFPVTPILIGGLLHSVQVLSGDGHGSHQAQ